MPKARQSLNPKQKETRKSVNPKGPKGAISYIRGFRPGWGKLSLPLPTSEEPGPLNCSFERVLGFGSCWFRV